MKKFFLSALMVCGAGLAMVGCNNGDYDANPDTNNSNINNPFYNGGGGNGGGGNGGSTFGVGSIWGKVNGTQMNMGGYAVDTLGIFVIQGTRSSAPLNVFQFNFFTYDGKKVYELNENENGGIAFGYYSFDGTPKVYQAGGVADKAHMRLEITDDDGKEIKGTFDGVAYDITNGTTNLNDSVVITEGKFHVKKR